jgi:transposase InsO family protein
MGIRDRPTAPCSPWQNGHVERLIGSIRRKSLDHFVVFGDAHLRDVLKTYASHYNEVRPHFSLDKDAPDFPADAEDRLHRSDSNPRRAASPICPGLGFE